MPIRLSLIFALVLSLSCLVPGDNWVELQGTLVSDTREPCYVRLGTATEQVSGEFKVAFTTGPTRRKFRVLLKCGPRELTTREFEFPKGQGYFAAPIDLGVIHLDDPDQVDRSVWVSEEWLQDY